MVEFINGQNRLKIIKMVVILNIETKICRERLIIFENQTHQMKAGKKRHDYFYVFTHSDNNIIEASQRVLVMYI